MGRRYKEALEASKRIMPTKDTNKEYVQSLLKTLTFPVPQPGSENKKLQQGYIQRSLTLILLLNSLIHTQLDPKIKIPHTQGMVFGLPCLIFQSPAVFIFLQNVFSLTVKPTGISLFDTQKWSLHVHYIEHRFNKEIQKSVEKQNEN